MFGYYKTYKLQFLDCDIVAICDWYGQDNSLCCANLDDAKKQIDKRIEDYNIADTPPCTQSEVPQINQEGINPMFDECNMCAPCAPTPKSLFKKGLIAAPVANAQVIAAAPIEANQRDHAIARIRAIGEKHASALRVLFHMDNITPKTFLELEAIIKAGNYTVTDVAKGDDAQYYSLFHGIKFGKPADKDGYNAARDILKGVCQKYIDVVTMKPLDEAFNALEEFEAWTYNPKS